MGAALPRLRGQGHRPAAAEPDRRYPGTANARHLAARAADPLHHAGRLRARHHCRGASRRLRRLIEARL